MKTITHENGQSKPFNGKKVVKVILFIKRAIKEKYNSCT